MTSLDGKFLCNGKYAIASELGRGGFGITYKAVNQVLDQTVVIKALNNSLRQDPNFDYFQTQFQAEAKRLAKFSHPNIVRVIDFFNEDGLPYIVMDYVPGLTLSQMVIKHPLPEKTAIQYIRQIGVALDVVHQHNLLHRDVKPQNIILRRDTQQAILIDFGIAREFTLGVTQTHTGMVSAGYAPIEQYLLHEKRTPATDVYGLAATLYTLLTAQTPVPSTLRDRSPLPPPRELRPELSEQVEQAVLRGMEIEQHNRPASVRAWMALLPLAQATTAEENCVPLVTLPLTANSEGAMTTVVAAANDPSQSQSQSQFQPQSLSSQVIPASNLVTPDSTLALIPSTVTPHKDRSRAIMALVAIAVLGLGIPLWRSLIPGSAARLNPGASPTPISLPSAAPQPSTPPATPGSIGQPSPNATMSPVAVPSRAATPVETRPSVATPVAPVPGVPVRSPVTATPNRPSSPTRAAQEPAQPRQRVQQSGNSAGRNRGQQRSQQRRSGNGNSNGNGNGSRNK